MYHGAEMPLCAQMRQTVSGQCLNHEFPDDVSRATRSWQDAITSRRPREALNADVEPRALLARSAPESFDDTHHQSVEMRTGWVYVFG
jgi:hypothetical protein